MNVLPPIRAKRTSTIHLTAPPNEVFPTLCPVREVEWASGWDPLVVYTTCGLVEQECVFTTRGEEADAIWVVTRHEPEDYQIEMLKVTPGETVGKLEISLAPAASGGTAAEISYSYTALGARGREFVEGFTEQAYAELMASWERELNHYLETGGMLEEPVPGYD